MLPLKILSWNIEHFNGLGGIDRQTRALRQERVERVIAVIEDEAPDVFGLSEVEGSFVYERMTAAFPGHVFHVTTGSQSQQILIGVRPGLGSFFTQKDEFRRNNIYLRPGALLTVREGDIHVPVLFVHLKSMPSPEGFGLRDAMFERIFSLKKALDSSAADLAGDPDAKANFIVLGDCNTMGMDYAGATNDIPGEREIEVIKARMARRQMRSPPKSHPFTFNNGSGSSYPPSELDHVFVAKHIALSEADGAQVQVKGWAALSSTGEQDDWIEAFSDHAPLVFTVTAV